MSNGRHPHAAGLDTAANRRATKYTATELFRRFLWTLVTPLFRFSPRPLFAWRRFLLRLFGARIGEHVHVYGSATIYMPWNLSMGSWSSLGEHCYVYNLGKVTIGSHVTVSQHAYLCAGTHDYERADMLLIKTPITIGDDVWICAGAFVGPGVTVHDGAVVGARAVLMSDAQPWTVLAGNPARTIRERQLRKGE